MPTAAHRIPTKKRPHHWPGDKPTQRVTASEAWWINYNGLWRCCSYQWALLVDEHGELARTKAIMSTCGYHQMQIAIVKAYERNLVRQLKRRQIDPARVKQFKGTSHRPRDPILPPDDPSLVVSEQLGTVEPPPE